MSTMVRSTSFVGLHQALKEKFGENFGERTKGIHNVWLGVLIAASLYAAGVVVVSYTPWFLNPFGYLSLTYAMVELYRVGFTCTTLCEKPAFQSNLLRRVVGQLSLLLLLRPIISLRTPRLAAASGNRLLGSRRLAWVVYKVRLAYSFQQQLYFSRVHPELQRHPYAWMVVQFAAVIVFALIFFPALLLSSGISGAVRFWLIPFIGMHMHIGSFNMETSKQGTREKANLLFTYPVVRVRTIPVLPANGHSAGSAAGASVKRAYQAPHWFNIFYLGFMHLGALYGILVACTSASSTTLAIGLVVYHIAALGITGGAHRLWAHRSYSAHWTVELFLMLCNCMANEGSIFKWSRDHRVHHKHVDTEKDPHNAERGFWYSHMGWLLVRKDPAVVAAGKEVHMEDLLQNRIVMFQHRYYPLLGLGMCFLLPAVVTHLIAGQFWEGFWIAGVLRYCCTLHSTWLVNSLAHLWGTRPYLPNILPVDNLLVSIFALGEGWHNYHHAYPYDYSANEYGWWQWNPTTLFLDICAALGLVWDRRRGRVRRASPASGKEDEEDLPLFSMEDVRASAGQAAMVLVINGYVYDVADFVDQKLHPGGERIIKAWIGKDATKAFTAGSKHTHTEAAYNLLVDYRVGKLKE